MTESAFSARGVVCKRATSDIFFFRFLVFLAAAREDLHAPGAATRRRFFDVFSDVFLD